MMAFPTVHIEIADVLSYRCDLLALKYAQSLHRVDLNAAEKLLKDYPDLEHELPKAGDYLILETNDRLGAKKVLFIGTVSLLDLKYPDIERFASSGLEIAEREAP